jgi:hypothetical protein
MMNFIPVTFPDRLTDRILKLEDKTMTVRIED